MRLKSDLVMLIYGAAGRKEGFYRNPEGADAFPPMDVTVIGEEIHIWMDIPCVKEEDITIYMRNNMLVIEGQKRPYYNHEKRRTFLRMERRYQPFRRILQLTKFPSAIHHRITDGVLHIVIT